MKHRTLTFPCSMAKASKWLLIVILQLTLALSFTSCSLLKNLLAPRETGLKAYEGKWFVIARLPNRYEDGLVCTTSDFEYNADGTLKVTVSGREKTPDGKIKSFTTRAWLPDKKRPDLFRVQIFFTVTQDYRLVYMSEDNTCAVLGTPSKRMMWILCREPLPDEEITAALVQIAGKNGFRTERLEKVGQACGE